MILILPNGPGLILVPQDSAKFTVPPLLAPCAKRMGAPPASPGIGLNERGIRSYRRRTSRESRIDSPMRLKAMTVTIRMSADMVKIASATVKVALTTIMPNAFGTR